MFLKTLRDFIKYKYKGCSVLEACTCVCLFVRALQRNSGNYLYVCMYFKKSGLTVNVIKCACDQKICSAICA